VSALAALNTEPATLLSSARRITALETPQDHFRVLASNQKHDHLLLAMGRKATEGKEWFKLKPDWALEQLARFHNEPDVFVTPNEFYGWRLIRLLSALNAFYVDIDIHDGCGCPVKAAWDAIDKVSLAKIPEPNMVVYTGRGAHLYWLFGRTPKQALPRWQVVQRALVQLTSGDTQAMDATRVLRLVGTQNSQADRTRRSVRAEVINPNRYDFDWLCDQIVIPRAEIRSLQAARARKEAREPHETSIRRVGRRQLNSIYEVWYYRYQDLIKITDAYWFGGVPPGHRNQMLLHMSIALSWFAKAEALKDEITHIARHHMPSFSDRDIESTVTSVLKRAVDAANGKKYEWSGMYVDPRYRYKSQTLWEIFGDLVMAKPELIPQLRSIIPPEERERRHSEFDAQRDRVQEGRYKVKRSEYIQQTEGRKQEAQKLLEEGMSTKAVADRLKVSQRTTQTLQQEKRFASSEKRKGDALLLFQQGFSTKEIATQLGITMRSVQMYLTTTPDPEPLSHGSEMNAKSARLVYTDNLEMTSIAEVESSLEAIQALRSKGLTIRKIAEITGLSKSKVDRALKSYPQASFVPRAKSAPVLYGLCPSRSDLPIEGGI
jgi:DNA-binding CsgD family transcriptional regulator